MSLPYPPSDSTLEITPPSAVELLWINHRASVIGAVAVIVLVAVVVLAVIWSTHATRIASENLLSAATDASGWNEVIARYPHTPAGADAMLLLAASLRDSGKIDASNEVYSRFAESFPNSPLAISGLLGRAANARVSNQPDVAVSSYQEAAASFPQSYGAPFALFTEIQLLAQQGKTDDAKRILQSLVTQYPGSASAQTFGGGKTPTESSSGNSTNSGSTE